MSVEAIESDAARPSGAPDSATAVLQLNAYSRRPGASPGAPPADLGYELLPLLNDALRILDVVAVAVSGLLCWWLLDGGFDGARRGAFAQALLIGVVLTPFVLQRAPEVRPYGAKGAWEPCREAVLYAVILFGLLIVIGFLADASIEEIRPLVLAWFGASAVAMAGLRLTLALYVTRLERQGVLCEHIAIVGAGPLADRLIAHLRETRGASVDIVGIFDDRATRLADGATRPQGRLDDLVELGRGRRIDRVIVTLPWSAEERILQIMRRLKALSVDVLLCPDRIGFSLPKRPIDSTAGLPLLCLADRPMRRWAYVLKLLEDRVLASLLLLLFSPVMLAVALAVRLDSPGPILFRQRRHGFNNAEIEVFKFRTMRHEASDALGSRQASRTDSRVTRVGRFLRRTSFDELPQLINVVRGDMSLIGPRPHPIGMRTADQLCHEIVEDYAHRHRVKPGMTGWAQVNGYRGATETPAQLQGRVSYDLYYIDNWSLRFDLKILLMTFINVVAGENRF